MAEQEFTPEELENEIWKSIPGYENIYEVSGLGRVRGVPRIVQSRPENPLANNVKIRLVPGRVLRPRKGNYQNIALCKGGQNKAWLVHRLVLLSFVGNPPKDKPQCNHKDGNKMNNRLSNLEWVSNAKNIQHAFDAGLCGYHVRVRRPGETNPFARLSTKDVIEIKQCLKRGEFHRRIAKRFGVAKSTISMIAIGKTWQHVTLPG